MTPLQTLSMRTCARLRVAFYPERANDRSLISPCEPVKAVFSVPGPTADAG
jgi:hypothetical protein